MSVWLPISIFAIFAGLFCAVLTAIVLRALSRRGVEQAIREDGPESHLKKGKTPAMGGIAIIATIAVFCVLIWYVGPFIAIPASWHMLMVAGIMLMYALVGLKDDLAKVSTGKSDGWKARYKIITELIFAVIFMTALVICKGDAFHYWRDSFQWLWAPFGVFILVGGSNAVNLTDGLDGLAAGLSSIAATAMGVILLITGDTSMAVLCFAIAGAAAGFLWLNAHPAKIFMGDVGSLGLGAALSAIAVVSRIELLFALVAAVFAWETLSVMIQVVYFRLTHGKRVFKMAPFHHHLELSGWAEPTVVLRLWLIGALCAVLAIAIAAALSMPFPGGLL